MFGQYGPRTTVRWSDSQVHFSGRPPSVRLSYQVYSPFEWIWVVSHTPPTASWIKGDAELFIRIGRPLIQFHGRVIIPFIHNNQSPSWALHSGRPVGRPNHDWLDKVTGEKWIWVARQENEHHLDKLYDLVASHTLFPTPSACQSPCLPEERSGSKRTRTYNKQTWW